jgi:T5SS/PEP-CTERM-associated repeat protein
MTVGDLGRGTLQVFNQGRMETLNAVLANGLGSFANVEVAGAGSVWEITGFFNLGVSGHSTMQIRDGGRITNTGAGRLATTDDSESHVEVSGANSLWAVGSTLTVGENGRGTLEILAGGRVTSTIVRLGDNAGARGDATVDGNGSTWKINGELNISDPAEATLTISNGALVTTTDVTRVNAAGTLNLDGGRLTVEHLAGTTNQGLIQGGGTITGAVRIRRPAKYASTPATSLCSTTTSPMRGWLTSILANSKSLARRRILSISTFAAPFCGSKAGSQITPGAGSGSLAATLTSSARLPMRSMHRSLSAVSLTRRSTTRLRITACFSSRRALSC